ncbi:MAG: hypothetical protein KBB37_01825 [Bacteroidia bacterium]|nr:hypothetical protein [Bacteroidia bacterium]MBP7259996.1 hypothetical protein [Bacteroidia bacterium]MBP9179703.1 hypothetical protein [Bacteroidia bacterium]MBP9723898.1 hypothetical protein [Bacteroidia bacterium]
MVTVKNKQSAQTVKLSTVGGEEIPPGGWRGGEEIPPGGWRGGEEIPPGGWRGGEEIPPGGWRAVIDTYRSKNGRYFFKFRFYPVGTYYDVDIMAMPDYNGRANDLHTTHRLRSERSDCEYKICFGNPSTMSDLDTARRWAASWSELTVKYIETGAQFPNT